MSILGSKKKERFDPKMVQQLYEAAEELYSRSQYARAVCVFEELARNYDRLDSLLRTVDCHVKLGKRDLAIREMETFLEKHPGSKLKDRDRTLLCWEVASLMDETKDYRGKLRYLGLIGKKDKSGKVLLEQARTYAILNDHREAKKAFDALIECDRNNDVAWMGLAKEYEALEMEKKAVKTYEEIAKRFKGNIESRVWLAKRDLGKRRYNGAMDLISSAAELELSKDRSSQDKNIFITAGKIHTANPRSGDIDKAIGFFTSALSIDDDDIDVHQLRSDLLIKKQDEGSLDHQWYAILAYDLYRISMERPTKNNIGLALKFINALPSDIYWPGVEAELKRILFTLCDDETAEIGMVPAPIQIPPEDPVGIQPDDLIGELRPLLGNGQFGSVRDDAYRIVMNRLFYEEEDPLALYFKQVFLLASGEYNRAEREAGDILFRMEGYNRFAEDSASFWDRVADAVSEANIRADSLRYSKKDLYPLELEGEAVKKLLEFVSGRSETFLASVEPMIKVEDANWEDDDL